MKQSRWLERESMQKLIFIFSIHKVTHTDQRLEYISGVKTRSKESKKRSERFPFPKMGVHREMFIFISFASKFFSICSQLCWTTMNCLLNKKSYLWPKIFSSMIRIARFRSSRSLPSKSISKNAHYRLIAD